MQHAQPSQYLGAGAASHLPFQVMAMMSHGHERERAQEAAARERERAHQMDVCMIALGMLPPFR